MAVVSGTNVTYGGIGIREDLEDTIWDLFPEDTYALTTLNKVSAQQTFHEWQADTLGAAAANRQLEGDDATFASAAQPTRYGNYTQISRKTFIISETFEAVNKAGRSSEVARVSMKAMRELKRDIELALVGNQAASAGGATTVRSCAGMESWIPGPTTTAGGTGSNAVRPTTVTTGTTTAITSGGPDAPTDPATTAALVEDALKTALEGSWDDGGDVDVVLSRPVQKKLIDQFTGVATRFVDVARGAQASITGAADMYVSDFGTHKIVLHRYMRTSVVLCLDTSMWAVAFLRRPFTEQLAKTGDATKHQLLAEFTLVARNPIANAKVVGLT